MEMLLKDVFERKVTDISGPLIYRVYNVKNNKSYIGKTKTSLLYRFSSVSRFNHYGRFLNGEETKLYNAIRNDGVESFKVQILETGVSDLDSRERHYISEYDSVNNGYNDTIGGKAFSKLAQINGAKKLSEHCRNSRSGAFFNAELHSKVCSLGGYEVSRLKAKRIVDSLNADNIEVSKLSYDKRRKEIGPHNAPKYDTAFRNFPELFSSTTIM